MKKSTHRSVSILAFATVLAACDGRVPAGPTSIPPAGPPAAPATVTAISPTVGSTARPTRVTISGTGFLPGAMVTIDVLALNIRVVNSTTITAVVPPRAVGPADVVVNNPVGSSARLAAAFTYSFEEPFTLTPSTDVVDAGGRMTVSWIAPSGHPDDWVALCKVGARYDDDWYGTTNGATSGTLVVTAPTQPGQYEFRYLFDFGLPDLARSRPVTVR